MTAHEPPALVAVAAAARARHRRQRGGEDAEVQDEDDRARPGDRRPQIGMTKAKAVKTWGKPEHCQDSPLWCQFRADSHINGFTTNNPFAGWYLKAGKIVAIEIEFAENTAIDPKLVKLKTSKGIHLGSIDGRRAQQVRPGAAVGRRGGALAGDRQEGQPLHAVLRARPAVHEDRGDPGRDLRRCRARRDEPAAGR